MEGRQPRSFAEDYKRQAIEVAVSSSKQITLGAKELGLHDSALRNLSSLASRTSARPPLLDRWSRQ